MTEVLITVRGRHLSRVRPQRASVSLEVAIDGPHRAQVVDAVSRGAASLRALLGALESAGSVAEWSSDSLLVSSHRPWNAEGTQLAPVIRAVIGVIATFSDVDALGPALDDLVSIDGVVVHHIEWSLSDERLSAELDGARVRAVADAAEKANAYARAAGLDGIRPLAIADAGMLDGSTATRETDDRRLMSGAVGDATGVSLRPRDIVVEAVVDARFAAG